jgi:hypothetical protein
MDGIAHINHVQTGKIIGDILEIVCHVSVIAGDSHSVSVPAGFRTSHLPRAGRIAHIEHLQPSFVVGDVRVVSRNGHAISGAARVIAADAARLSGIADVHQL